MPILQRTSAAALALLFTALAAAPAGAQADDPGRFQQHRFQQRPQQPHPQQQRPQQQAPQLHPQEAQRRRGGNGAGIAAGALLGGALSNRGGAYAEPGYAGEVEGGPGYGGGCPLVRRPVYDGAGQFAGYQEVPSC